MQEEPGSIPGLGRSAGEGMGYPLQYSWASLVAQLVKNLPAVQETWVHSLGWEDPMQEGLATQSSILAWRVPTDRGAWQATVHGVERVRHDLVTKPPLPPITQCQFREQECPGHQLVLVLNDPNDIISIVWKE